MKNKASFDKQLFSSHEYGYIHKLVFDEKYPGYRPSVIESPNGDGKLDVKKRFSHIAEKYLNNVDDLQIRTELLNYLNRAHTLAVEIALKIGVPREFLPVQKYSALRVLEYDADAITHNHTDFDLFTIMCYRNLPDYFKYTQPESGTKREFWLKSLHDDIHQSHLRMLNQAKSLNSQIHFGEILEEIDSNIYKADDHEVIASNGPTQHSIVYFAIPDHDSLLPSGITVGKWIDERIKRSRYER